MLDATIGYNPTLGGVCMEQNGFFVKGRGGE